LARDGATRRFDPPDDRLDAAERGLEWGAALLKARVAVRQANRLRRPLRGDESLASRPGKALQGRERTASGSRDQEALFERLREAAAHAGGNWDCTIEGSGNHMRVRLSDPVSARIAWSCTGSAARVLGAFTNWLRGRPP
jgi:hypothetical protein